MVKLKTNAVEAGNKKEEKYDYDATPTAYRDWCAAARRILLPHVSAPARPRRSAARHCSPASCASQSANPARRASAPPPQRSWMS
jgi:hypothetical protein